MWDVILFDLDGTITDPKEGITKSVAYALEHFGFCIEDPDILTHFIGPPLLDSFRGSYFLTEDQALEAINIYRQRYSTVGWAENMPYPHIKECLSHLKSAGKTLMIATSKAEPYAVKILDHFGLSKYFDVICGTPLDDLKQTKADVIRNALARGRVLKHTRAVMVGDRKHDVVGGREAGIQTVGVLYGYGNREELEAYNADHIVKDIIQLEQLLLK